MKKFLSPNTRKGQSYVKVGRNYVYYVKNLLKGSADFTTLFTFKPTFYDNFTLCIIYVAGMGKLYQQGLTLCSGITTL